MGQLLIRDLDDTVLDALRERAARAGHSVEDEARYALTGILRRSREASLARLGDVRAQIGAVDGPSSLDDLRADRARNG
jgi:plasmid stability protein